MATLTVPTINAALCTGWTEQDRFLYNKLPFYLTKIQLKYIKYWSTWDKLTGKIPWEANMGNTMRSVSKEPAPVLRQQAFPQPLSSAPKKDIIDVRERTVDAIVFRHRFETPIFNFLPNFQDFLKNHITAHAESLNAQIARYNDVFLRGNIFNQSPYLFLPNAVGGEVVNAPMSDSVTLPTETYDAANKLTTITGAGKTSGYLSSIFPLVGQPGNLSFNAINMALNVLETDLAIPPFEGNGMPSGDNNPLDSMYCLVLSGEAWNQFIYDPWYLKNKTLMADVAMKPFKGSLFNRIIAKLEQYPIRISADGTFPDPQTRELNPNAFNFGESVPNPGYVNAPFEVAFLVGYGDGYESIEVGPPPSQFTSGGLPKGFGNMFWNGELRFTQNLLIPCTDSNGNIQWDTNKYGEELQIISQLVCGMRGVQKRSILPIVFKRWRGANNPVNQ